MTTQGKIRLGVPVVQMGQGIYNSLALCVVEELEMTLDQVEHIETVFSYSLRKLNYLIFYKR